MSSRFVPNVGSASVRGVSGVSSPRSIARAAVSPTSGLVTENRR